MGDECLKGVRSGGFVLFCHWGRERGKRLPYTSCTYSVIGSGLVVEDGFVARLFSR